MSLKIEHLDENSVTGTLDGVLPVIVARDGRGIRARIAGFTHDMPAGSAGADTPADMRHAVYAAVARYREARLAA